MIIAFCVLSFGSIYAQTIVKGNVKEKVDAFEKNLPFANVYIEGSVIGTTTDMEGNYQITISEPGAYTLSFSFLGYQKQTKQIVAKGNDVLEFNVVLIEDGQTLSEVKVAGKANRENVSMLLLEQKKAVLATQAIGAVELSQKGVSDAEGAVTKVSGISKQEGVKNVFVRGLGDRFNATMLNGIPVPSEDPEYKNISLDFFTSDMIQSVGVNKAFSANMSGDVGGAIIDVHSKELIGNKDLEFGFSTGFNSQTLGNDFIKPDGVNNFGFAKNTQGPVKDYATNYAFKNSLDPTSSPFRMNQDYKFTVGNKIGRKSSFLALASTSSDYTYNEGVVRYTLTSGKMSKDMNYEKYTRISSHLGMINFSSRIGTMNLNYNALLIHTNKQVVGDYFGLETEKFQDEPYVGLLRRQQVNDNTLIVNQLNLNYEVNSRLRLFAAGGLNNVFGNEPDRRINYLYLNQQDSLSTLKGTGNQQRYFSTLKESDINVRAGATLNLTENDDNNSKLNFGYTGRFVNRSFEAIEYDQSVVREFNYSRDAIFLDGDFNQKSLDQKKFILDRNDDTYSVETSINDIYGNITYQVNKLVVDFGLKFDVVNIYVPYNVNRGGKKGSSSIDEMFILPALNLKYDLNDKNALRLSLSKTYTLPQAKEISPFRYIGENFKSQGNEKLQPSTNYNVDVKWDYFLSLDELLSVTAFYKQINDPISRVEIASAGGFLSYENVTDLATVYGVEFELRKNILDIGTSVKKDRVSLGFNGSFIYSNMSFDKSDPLVIFTNENTQLEGASPLLFNTDISYNLLRNRTSFTATALVNYFSDRVYSIGTNGFEDINELSVTTLDVIASFKFGGHWSVGLKARNLLNPTYVLERQPSNSDNAPVVLQDFKKGSSYSIGVGYKF